MRLKMLTATAVLSLVCAAAHTDGVTQSGYSPLYRGVDAEAATVPSNPATAGGPSTVSRASEDRSIGPGD